MESTKRCPGCERILPFTAEYFYRCKSAASGLTARCRDCRRVESREKRTRPEVKARIQTYNAKWQQENPGYNLTRTEEKRQWVSKNRDRYLASSKQRKANRRAREAAAEGSFTPQQLLEVYAQQAGKCFWCTSLLNGIYHADHLMPLNRGGSNYVDNIVISCPRCNQQRGDKTESEYRDYLKRLANSASRSAI